MGFQFCKACQSDVMGQIMRSTIDIVKVRVAPPSFPFQIVFLLCKWQHSVWSSSVWSISSILIYCRVAHLSHKGSDGKDVKVILHRTDEDFYFCLNFVLFLVVW